MHGRRRQVGSLFLGGFGVALGLLMVYTLLYEGPSPASAHRVPRGEIVVPVLFLQRSEWRIFARGVAACVKDRKDFVESDDAVVVETPRTRRKVRFAWHVVRGEGGAREVVHKSLEAKPRPLAVVGSSNTVVTEALARQLAEDAAELGVDAPPLLVPWATSAAVTRLYPGRTFRFCSDNAQQAKLVVERLAARRNRPGPTKVMIMAESLDPYSVELGECYRRELAAAFPKAEFLPIVGDFPRHRPRLSARSNLPTTSEQTRAKEICQIAIENAPAETLVVLPLQNEPARRMLAAINGALPNHQVPEHALTVVCGDAVGQATLTDFVSQFGFNVWSMRTALPRAGIAGSEEDVQEPAEIVATLLDAVDRPGEPPTVGDLMLALHRNETSFRPFGRPILFDPAGERTGVAAGEVLVLRSDAAAVEAFADGRWTVSAPATRSIAPTSGGAVP